jgi:ATP-binding cassette subfamily B protein
MDGDAHRVLERYDIELDRVSFAYNREDVIKNVSLSIPQGKVTALAGPSGSGKSTLARLIVRFWDVGDGDIRIGGVSIRSIEPETLMRYMSFVFQDVTLFNDTVMNNIRVGKSGASDEEVYAAVVPPAADQSAYQACFFQTNVSRTAVEQLSA